MSFRAATSSPTPKPPLKPMPTPSENSEMIPFLLDFVDYIFTAARNMIRRGPEFINGLPARLSLRERCDTSRPNLCVQMC